MEKSEARSAVIRVYGRTSSISAQAYPSLASLYPAGQRQR